MLKGVTNRCRGGQKLRETAVKLSHAFQPQKHVGHVRPKYAAIRVKLIDYHVFQTLEQRRPLCVVRQNPAVQHVGIGHYDSSSIAGGAASVAGGIAIKNRYRYRQMGFTCLLYT